MISFVALTIDTLLPAYTEIKIYFAISDSQLHWIITALFIGFSFGQIIFGPLSDRIGRHKAILIGVGIYLLGCTICYFSSSYITFVIGRLIQGFGIGGPRVVSQAICRDLFSGNKLASINSFIMSIFILIPVVAPLVGQTIMLLFYWKSIIVFFIFFSLLTTILLRTYLEETLKTKRELSISKVLISFKEVLKNSKSLIYITSLGILLGGLLTFINICQPLFQNYFNLGLYFPLIFGAIAAMLGISSFINSKLVIKFGAIKLSLLFSFILMIWSTSNLLIINLVIDASLIWFSIFVMFSFSFFGMIFGNLNALAIDPFEHISGYASSTIGALSTMLAIIISGTATSFYDGTPAVFLITLTICSIVIFLLLSYTNLRPRD